MSKSKFKVGDTVYSLTKGKGAVARAALDSKGVVEVIFDNDEGSEYYLPDGKRCTRDIRPEIYLSEPQVKIKVKKEVRRWLDPRQVDKFGFKSKSECDKYDYPAIEVTVSWEEEIEG